MRIPSQALAGIAVFGLFVTGSSNPTDANPSSRMPYPTAQRVERSAVRQPESRRHRSYVQAPGCTSNYSTSGEFFVGVLNQNDVAGSLGSAVLGGNYNEACDIYSSIGGGNGNIIGPNGESGNSFIGAGYGNSIIGNEAFIGGGSGNEAARALSFVGAGTYGNALGAGSFVGAGGDESYGAVAGSGGNGDIAAGIDSFVGAGDLNHISGTGNGSFIGGGGYLWAATYTSAAGNQVSGSDSFIGAGDQNTISANEAFIGGGVGNLATGQKGTVGGGEANGAEGSFATVPGGYHDIASGNESFAAGSQAEATYVGSFVWSDYLSSESPLKDTKNGEFIARASGGVIFYSNPAATSGVSLAAGSGTWSSLSDRNAKTHIVPLDDASILAKVAALPVSTWQYKTEAGVRHVGPMAQDFYAAFRVGEDDRHITSIDEDGVALAAIKALHRENDRLRSNFSALAAKNAALERRLDALAARMRP